MLSLISNKNELEFLWADPYSARITALAETYGTDYDFALFWVQKINDVPVAAISRVDGNMTVCCNDNADFEEMACFIGAVGYLSITLDAKFAERLGITPQKSSYTVRYRGGAKNYENEILFDYNKKDVYSLLCECGFDMGDYNAFLSDVCIRLNKKTASMGAVENNGRLSACAFALFEGKKSVLLGAVATNPLERGRGYASKIVGTLAETKKEKEVFLFCREDSLVEFYKKVGFEAVGMWAVS